MQTTNDSAPKQECISVSIHDPLSEPGICIY